MSPINLAIVGVGKIVRDQHLPAVAKNADYRLIAAASRHGTVDGSAGDALGRRIRAQAGDAPVEIGKGRRSGEDERQGQDQSAHRSTESQEWHETRALRLKEVNHAAFRAHALFSSSQSRADTA